MGHAMGWSENMKSEYGGVEMGLEEMVGFVYTDWGERVWAKPYDWKWHVGEPVMSLPYWKSKSI